MKKGASQGEISRDGLISVPLATRPRREEIPVYLQSFQSYVLGEAIQLIESRAFSGSNAQLESVDALLRRLVTSLSTDIHYIRIPVVWYLYNKLIHENEAVDEKSLENVSSDYRSLIDALGILLSHFDLSRHLDEAERRVAGGDDKIDEALFVELEERVIAFDEGRAAVYSDVNERTKRFGAVLALPSGAVPKATVMVYRFISWLNDFASFFLKRILSLAGGLFAVSLLVQISGFEGFDLIGSIIDLAQRLLAQ